MTLPSASGRGCTGDAKQGAVRRWRAANPPHTTGLVTRAHSTPCICFGSAGEQKHLPDGLVTTGWACPACGGPSSKQLTLGQTAIDRKTRLQISHELGHGREQIATVYLGR